MLRAVQRSNRAELVGLGESPRRMVTDCEASVACEQHLRTEHLLPNLKRLTVSSGIITASAEATKFALTLGGAVILARLLTPIDFGLLGMVTTVTGFLAIFSDAGLSTATIQAEAITQEQASSLFWINFGLSGVMGLLSAMLAPVLAWFYHDGRLIAITLLLSLTFPLTGIVVQHRALLNRQMKFRTLAIIDVGSLLVSVVTGCTLGVLRCGYWSLVGMQFSAAVSGCLLTWGGSRWRPQRPGRGGDTRAFVRFGLDLTGSSLIYRIARGCDTILLGRFWGPASVGLYSRASVLLLRPIEQMLSPISSVLLPALSRLSTDPVRYRQAFLRAYDGIGLMSFPLTAVFLATAHPLVLVLLGPKWEGVVGLFEGFTVLALYLPLASSANWLFTSQGRSREMLVANVILCSLTVIAFFAGLPYGALGMVLCFSISGLVIRLPILYHFAGRRGPVGTADLWEVFFHYVPLWASVYGAATLACALTKRATPPEQLLAGLLAGLAAAVATVCALDHQRQTARWVYAAMRASLVAKLAEQTSNAAGSAKFPGLSVLRNWFKSQNEKGNFIGFRSAWRYLNGLSRFHPPERFANFLLVQTKVAVGSWRPFKVPEGVVHGRFDIYEEKPSPERRLVKLPHGRNRYSCALIRQLRRPGALRQYRDTLRSIKLDRWLKDHCPTVTGFQSGEP
jgi:O-antigen/teichoic acid export membrane protein